MYACQSQTTADKAYTVIEHRAACDKETCRPICNAVECGGLCRCVLKCTCADFTDPRRQQLCKHVHRVWSLRKGQETDTFLSSPPALLAPSALDREYIDLPSANLPTCPPEFPPEPKPKCPPAANYRCNRLSILHICFHSLHCHRDESLKGAVEETKVV